MVTTKVQAEVDRVHHGKCYSTTIVQAELRCTMVNTTIVQAEVQHHCGDAVQMQVSESKPDFFENESHALFNSLTSS